jgi:hypothetical protein
LFVILASVLLTGLTILVQVPATANAQQTTQLGDFIVFVFHDVDNYWSDVFTEDGLPYNSPDIKALDGPVKTSCGATRSGGGSFYCSNDDTVYVDVQFMSAIWRQNADFAVAYGIAHEMGHHVQNELGIHKSQNPQRPGEIYSLQLELMADCFAGTWANSTAQRGMLEVGDLEEAVNLAWNIGDDALHNNAPRTSLSAMAPVVSALVPS